MIPVCRYPGCRSDYAGVHTWHPDVSDEQIRALRAEALAGGDYLQADLCCTALVGCQSCEQSSARERRDARLVCRDVIARAALERASWAPPSA